MNNQTNLGDKFNNNDVLWYLNTKNNNSSIKSHNGCCYITWEQNEIMVDRFKVNFLNSMINLFLKLITLLLFLLPFTQHYTLTVTADNSVINSLAAYTYVFGFTDNTVRNTTLTLPDTSDLTSASLAININNNAVALAASSYTIDHTLKKITINNITPTSNTLTIKITNIKNPPSAIQFFFTTAITPT